VGRRPGRVLYAIDDAHGMPVGWLANRNAVLAAFFGVSAISAHDRWRRGPAAWSGLLAALLLSLSLLSAEAGIATCAYLLAYAVFIEPGPWQRRLASLLPYAVILVAWRIAWTLQGYGVHGLGLYADPLHQPGNTCADWASACRCSCSGSGGSPAMLLLSCPRTSSRALGDRCCRNGRIVLACVPAGPLEPDRPLLGLRDVVVSPADRGTFPADRLLVFVGVGAMALLAMFFESLPARKAAASSRFASSSSRLPRQAWSSCTW